MAFYDVIWTNYGQNPLKTPKQKGHMFDKSREPL
jgi:hypothetical protein